VPRIHSLSVSRIELESKGVSEQTVRLIVLLDRLGVPAFRRMLGNRGRRRDANKADRERAVQARPRKVGGRLRGPGEPASASGRCSTASRRRSSTRTRPVKRIEAACRRSTGR